MEEQLISFDTAKLAKEKGFNEYCTNGYITRRVLGLYFNSKFEQYKYGGDDSELLELCQNISFIPLYEPYYKTPTQSLLQKWLREKHNIHIEINEIPIKNNENIIHKFYIVLRGLKHELNLDDDDQGNWYPILSKTHTGYEVFESYEEALEAGLQEVLKLI